MGALDVRDRMMSMLTPHGSRWASSGITQRSRDVGHGAPGRATRSSLDPDGGAAEAGTTLGGVHPSGAVKSPMTRRPTAKNPVAQWVLARSSGDEGRGFSVMRLGKA